MKFSDKVGIIFVIWSILSSIFGLWSLINIFNGSIVISSGKFPIAASIGIVIGFFIIIVLMAILIVGTEGDVDE